MHRLTITAPDGTGATAAVTIDGRPAQGLTALTLTMDAKEVVRAELDLVMTPIQVDVNAEVTLVPETEAQLIALGWTPPAAPWNAPHDCDEFYDPACPVCTEDEEDEPDCPLGVMVTEKDGTNRAASAEEAKEWAAAMVERGTLPADHPSVLRARGESAQ
jgi:hypothetical protein